MALNREITLARIAHGWWSKTKQTIKPPDAEAVAEIQLRHPLVPACPMSHRMPDSRVATLPVRVGSAAMDRGTQRTFAVIDRQ